MKKILVLSIILLTLSCSNTLFSSKNNRKTKYHMTPSKETAKFQRSLHSAKQQENSRKAKWQQKQNKKKEKENIFPLWLRNIEI